jgi:hypothetical protein
MRCASRLVGALRVILASDARNPAPATLAEQITMLRNIQRGGAWLLPAAEIVAPRRVLSDC